MFSEITDSPIALIEFHDARIRTLDLLSQAPALEFAHLLVYHQRGPDRFSIWSYQASLQLLNLERAVVDGTPHDKDYVSEGIVIGKDGEQVSAAELLERTSVRSIKFTLGSGVIIDLRYLNEPDREVEEWISPL